MASNYQKLNTKIFNERLTNNQYANATGARRAVGKSEMTEDEKKKAHAAINRHFGVESEPASSTKRAATKRTATPAAAKTAATKGRGVGRGKRASSAKKAASARGGKATSAEGAPATSVELADLHAGAQATREAMVGLATASELDPGLDVKAAAQRGAGILQHSIDRIGELLGHPTSISTSSAPAATPSSNEEDEEEVEDEEDEEETDEDEEE